MRALALTACALVVLLPGCLDGLGAAMESAACEPVVEQAVGTTGETLYPAAAEGQVAVPQNPRVSIEVREGQMLTAHATWQSMGGAVRVAYDGPAGDIAQDVPRAWQSITYSAPAGNVTLGIDGDPLAFGVTYVLQLTATGC